MKLKQIELSCRDRDERSRQFNWSANTIADLFERQLRGYETDGVFRVNIRVVPATHDQLKIDSLVDVVEVDHPLDLDAYERTADFNRRALCAMAIKQSLDRVAKHRGWNRDPIVRAYVAIRDLGFMNVGRWRTPKANPSRKVRAQVEYDFGSAKLEGVVRFTDRADVLLGTRQLFSLPPSEFHLGEALGQLRWRSETLVELTSKDKQRTWAAAFEV